MSPSLAPPAAIFFVTLSKLPAHDPRPMAKRRPQTRMNKGYRPEKDNPYLNMENYPLLKEIVLVLAISLASVYILRRLKLPLIVGFIVAGVIIGPGALGLVEDRESIELLAEIGVTLLLFTIGLKFSLRELMGMKWLSLLGGGAQVVLTTLAVSFLVSSFSDLNDRQALLAGFLVALSSTAIVFKLLEERGESYTLQGRFIIAVLLFQDLAVVPLMLITLMMGGEGGGDLTGIAIALAKAVGLIAALLAVARFLFPFIIERIVRTRSREMFTLSAVLIALGTAWLGSLFGISLALGAFLAGVVISESAYSHQIEVEINPLRDVFNSLFFVSIGMLVDPRLWLDGLPLSLGLPLAVIALKALLIGGIAMLFGFGSRTAVLTGLGLAQIGEFSFVLAHGGASVGLLDDEAFSTFLSLAVITMALTPLLMKASPAIAGRAPRLAWLERYLAGGTARLRAGAESEEEAAEPLSGHVIIAGYGINGRNVARVLKNIEVPYTILELNPHTVKEMSARGEPIRYGDASRAEVLKHAGIDQARILLVAIADPVLTRQIVATGHQLSPDLTIIVRTRLVSEVLHLHQLGADEVVPEEFETSLELAGMVMATYGAAERVIERQKMLMRSERYSFLSAGEGEHARHHSLSALLSAADLDSLALDRDSCAAGKSLKELDLRRHTGISVLAVAREHEVISNPGAGFVLEEGDTVFLFGKGPELERAHLCLRRGVCARE